LQSLVSHRFCLLFGATLGVSIAGSAGAETLADAIALAYQTNPALQAERAQVRAGDEEYAQARAGYRPTVSANASYGYNDNDIAVFGVNTSNTSSAAISVNQPIYTGGRVAAQIDVAKADISSGREELRRAELGVIQSVIVAYVDVRRDEAQLAIADDNVSVLSRQQDQTAAEFEYGEVTRTDVAQSQARLAQAKAQLAIAHATLDQARADYTAVVGQSPGELAEEPPIDNFLPATIDQAFDLAEQNNPQLLQASYVERASAARLAEAKSQTHPSIGVSGTYGYNGGGPEVGGVVVGAMGGGAFSHFARDVTISATASVPLFAGGLYASQIRQAAEEDNASRMGVEVARREVLHTISQAWSALLGAKSSVTAYEEQVKADGAAYDGVRAEQEAGLRTVLDVLNAEQELEASKLALTSARHDEYAAAADVIVAIGSIEANAFAPNELLYDPTTNFNKVRHAFGAVPWEGALEAADRLGAPSPPSVAPRPAPPVAAASTGAGQ
jgi:outer membrane protein